MFRNRAKIPIEQRNYSVYYLLFSGLLFLGTMWAVVDEIATRRPWKDHQKEYRRLSLERIQARLEESIAELDSVTLEERLSELEAARDSVRGPTFVKTQEFHDRIQEEIIDETREFTFAKSRGDEAYYFYKKSLHEGKEDLSEKEKLRKHESEMLIHQTRIDSLQELRDSASMILEEYRENLRRAHVVHAELLKSVEKWQTKLQRTDAMSIEIRQVMLLDYDRNPFNDPKARIDRCQSCHLGWAEEIMEDAPQPYTKHPFPELLQTHNPEVYGCTPCHRGQGAALTAGFAHGEDDHYWENPKLEGKEVYASCNECHENESILPSAPPLTEAKRLVLESGCHGCHEIQGYTDIPKIGPELGRIAYKTTPSWIYRWLRSPKEYNPFTRMPDFHLSEEEAEAVTAYLVKVSEADSYSIPSAHGSGGDSRRGKLLFESVGCQACHVMESEVRVRAERGSSYDIAPELTRVGSKVSPAWLYDWLRNPRHFNPTTRMPNLRLTESEARDLVAYLMTRREESTVAVPSMNLESTTLIARGEKVIREYGCNGCHMIPGFEKEGRVSVSLSNFGRKKVEEMDFGDTKVEHSWRGWTTRKLKDARAFATDRIEQKMPIFSFNDSEVELLRLFLLAQTKDAPDPRYVRTYNLKQQHIETGRRIAIKYNCQQCHELEGDGAYLKAVIDDAALLPPILTGEGKKVQEPWLHDFLRSPTATGDPNSIRPWIATRMPTFQLNEEEINALIQYFLGLSNQRLELRDYASFRPDPILLPVGRQIFNDFQCEKCHPTGRISLSSGEFSTADLAPNLTKARDRLKPEWIVEWLADPGKLQAGTRMPTYFPDGQSPLPEVLDGDARKQMEAIRDHVINMGLTRRTAMVGK